MQRVRRRATPSSSASPSLGLSGLASQDPFLVGEYAVAWAQGFQRAPEAPGMLQASACCKHFVGNGERLYWCRRNRVGIHNAVHTRSRSLVSRPAQSSKRGTGRRAYEVGGMFASISQCPVQSCHACTGATRSMPSSRSRTLLTRAWEGWSRGLGGRGLSTHSSSPQPPLGISRPSKRALSAGRPRASCAQCVRQWGASRGPLPFKAPLLP